MNTTRRSSALTARARRYLTDAARAFEHAPIEVSLSVVLAVAFSYAVSSDGDAMPAWLEFAVVVVLAGAAAFIATLLHALGAWSTRARWAVSAAGAVAAALYGLLVLDFDHAAEAWRAAALVTAAVLLVLAAPALAARAGALERFRLVTGRLLIRLLAVLLYAAALYAGLALAIGAVNTLFELHLSGRTYAHVFGWIFIVLVTWVVIGGVPDYVRPAGDASPVASAVHRMSAFLVTPLLAIYYLILYAYSLRIAITGELPKNLVSPLVIAAGVIAGIALILFDRTEEEDRSFRSLRAAAPLFVPLCLLGIWAIVMRLNQYGWTEFRALRVSLLAVLGVLAVAAVVTVVRRRQLQLHLLPLTLAAVLILSAIGPWGVSAVSRRSQQGRLAAAMATAGLDWNATSVRDSVIASAAFTQISEAARYLLTHHGRAALPPLLARHAVSMEVYGDVAHAAGLRSSSPHLQIGRGGFAQLPAGTALLGDSADAPLYYVRIERPSERVDSTAADSAAASFQVRIPIAGSTLIADLDAISREVTAAEGRPLAPRLARVILRDDAGVERGQLFVLEISFGADPLTRLYRLVGVARLTPD